MCSLLSTRLELLYIKRHAHRNSWYPPTTPILPLPELLTSSSVSLRSSDGVLVRPTFNLQKPSFLKTNPGDSAADNPGMPHPLALLGPLLNAGGQERSQILH